MRFSLDGRYIGIIYLTVTTCGIDHEEWLLNGLERHVHRSDEAPCELQSEAPCELRAASAPVGLKVSGYGKLIRKVFV